jgi:hypothetical protein
LIEAGIELRKVPIKQGACDIDKIVTLYFEKNLTLKEVGEELGYSCTTVRKRLLEAGYELRHMTRDDLDVELINKLYLNGGTIKGIAKTLNCSESAVRHRIQSN